MAGDTSKIAHRFAFPFTWLLSNLDYPKRQVNSQRVQPNATIKLSRPRLRGVQPRPYFLPDAMISCTAEVTLGQRSPLIGPIGWWQLKASPTSLARFGLLYTLSRGAEHQGEGKKGQFGYCKNKRKTRHGVICMANAA